MNADKIFGFASMIVPALSVCEAMDNRLAYNGKTVIIGGRVVRLFRGGKWSDWERP